MQVATHPFTIVESGPTLSGRWVKAHILAAAVAIVTGSLLVVTGRLPALADITAHPFAAALAFVAVLLNVIAYAAFTGVVLGEKLPEFSRTAWIAAHASAALIPATIVAIGHFDGAPVVLRSLLVPGGRFDVPFILFVMLVAAPALFAIIGALQALLLHAAARGVAGWVAASAVAGGALAAIAVVAVLIEPDRAAAPLGLTLASQGAIVAAMLLMSLIGLPALHRLAPRI